MVMMMIAVLLLSIQSLCDNAGFEVTRGRQRVPFCFVDKLTDLIAKHMRG